MSITEQDKNMITEVAPGDVWRWIEREEQGVAIAIQFGELVGQNIEILRLFTYVDGQLVQWNPRHAKLPLWFEELSRRWRLDGSIPVSILVDAIGNGSLSKC